MPSLLDQFESYLSGFGGHSSVLAGGKITSERVGQFHPLDTGLASRLVAAGQAYQKETGENPTYGESDRSSQVQAVYYKKYRSGTGGIAARPGRSMHQQGRAVDLPRSGFSRWLQKGNAQKYGLHFPVRGDPNHVQANPAFKGDVKTGPIETASNQPAARAMGEDPFRTAGTTGMTGPEAGKALAAQNAAYIQSDGKIAAPMPAARPAAADRPAASATASANKGTVVFAHGMESRYGKTTPAQVEASMKKYADSRGMNFKAIPISGDKSHAQLKAIQSYPFKKGDVAVGFSAGGYNVAKAKLPAGVEKVVTGAPRAAGNKDYGGSHMQQPERLAAAAAKQQTAAATPKQQTGATASAAPQATPAKAQTVQQVIDRHRNDPQFSQLAQYETMIPDRHMPADQWVKQHGDILNNPMVPESARQVIQAAAKPAPAPPTVLREDKVAPTAQQVSQPQQSAQNVPLPQQRPPGLGAQAALAPSTGWGAPASPYEPFASPSETRKFQQGVAPQTVGGSFGGGDTTTTTSKNPQLQALLDDYKKEVPEVFNAPSAPDPDHLQGGRPQPRPQPAQPPQQPAAPRPDAGPTGPGATPTGPAPVDFARDTPGYNEEYGIHPPEPGPQGAVAAPTPQPAPAAQPDMGSKVLEFLGGGPQQAGTSGSMPQVTASPLQPQQPAAPSSTPLATQPGQSNYAPEVTQFAKPSQGFYGASSPWSKLQGSQTTASQGFGGGSPTQQQQPASPPLAQPQQAPAPPSSTPLATQPGQSNYAPQITQFAKPPQGFYGKPSLWEKLQGTQTTASQGFGGGSPTQQGGTQTQPLATAVPQPSAASPAPAPSPPSAAPGTPVPGPSTMTGGGFPMQMPQPGGGAQPTGMAPPQPGLSAGTPLPPAPAPMPTPSMGGGGGGGMGAPDMGAGAMGGEGGGMGGGGGGMGGGFGKALGGAASAMQKMIPKPNVTINPPISPGAGAPDFSQRILQFLQQGQQQFQPQQQDQAT